MVTALSMTSIVGLDGWFQVASSPDRLSRPDPEETSAVLISPPRSCRSDPHAGTRCRPYDVGMTGASLSLVKGLLAQHVL